VDRDLRRHLQELLGVVEDDLDAGLDEAVAWGALVQSDDSFDRVLTLDNGEVPVPLPLTRVCTIGASTSALAGFSPGRGM